MFPQTPRVSHLRLHTPVAMRHPLRPCDGSPALECELGNGGWCAILQTSVDDAQLAGVPASWSVEGVSYNRITLPCSHAFHVSALALHFCMSDMRCPVCREGPPARLCPSSIPRSIQHLFAAEHDSIETRTASFDAAHSACRPGAFTHPLYTGMRLVAEVYPSTPSGITRHKFTRFCSPVVCHPARDAERRYSVHRSFQRHVHAHMASVRSGTMRFVLSCHWNCFGTVRSPLYFFDGSARWHCKARLPIIHFPHCHVFGFVSLAHTPDTAEILVGLEDAELARMHASAA